MKPIWSGAKKIVFAFSRRKAACNSCIGFVTNCNYCRRTVELRDRKERCIVADMEDIKMAQAVLEREPNSAATEIAINIAENANAAPTPKKNHKQEDIILDWNSFLQSLWLGIMKTNPGFYDDALASTIVNSSLREVRKLK